MIRVTTAERVDRPTASQAHTSGVGVHHEPPVCPNRFKCVQHGVFLRRRNPCVSARFFPKQWSNCLDFRLQDLELQQSDEEDADSRPPRKPSTTVTVRCNLCTNAVSPFSCQSRSQRDYCACVCSRSCNTLKSWYICRVQSFIRRQWPWSTHSSRLSAKATRDKRRGIGNVGHGVVVTVERFSHFYGDWLYHTDNPDTNYLKHGVHQREMLFVNI